MTSFIVALIFLGLALSGVIIRKTYYYLPVRELKRRAAKNDPQAAKLYAVVAYERSLRALLWLFIGFTSAVSIILLSRTLPIWASVLIVGPILWIAFSFIPAARVSSFGMGLTLFVTPFIAWILDLLDPVLSNSTLKVEGRYQTPRHTRLFEKDDLIDLINAQQRQHDSRFTEEELNIAKRALEFTDQTVSQIVIPKKDTKTVKASDNIGPILIDEVYKSRQKYILVKEEDKGPFVGILDAANLGIQSEGYVRSLMQPTVYYLHEDDSLSDALRAFFVTNFPVFVVVNSHEEFVGIASIEEVLKKLMGHVPGEEFSEYSDMTAVANRHNPSEPKPKAESEDHDS